MKLRRRGPGDQEASPRPTANAGTELVVAAALAGAALAAVAFVVVYIVSADTQLLGLSLGLALGCLAVAAILAGQRLVPQEHVVEERPQFGDVSEQQQLELELVEPASGISRRKMLLGVGSLAGAAVGVAAVVPLASLGPSPGDEIGSSPWRRGLAVVDEQGRQLGPEDVPIGALVTGFPAGADPRELGSPVVLVRLPQNQLQLPTDRADWAPQGIVAYSKICTHAGCAISLYRYPLYRPTSPGPALVCPCHYSTFDPTRAGKRIFGPAGRSLPQLPLAIDQAGKLVAGGPFSGPVGPAWWGVRRT